MEGREKRRRQIVDETQSLGIECLGKDVWSLILKHLSLGYVRALRQTNKHIEGKTREYFFSNYVFYLGRMRNDNIPSMIREVHTHLISDYKRIEESNLKITYLRLSWLFNCSITIPPNVTHFRVGHSFNHPIALPSGLINFEMGWSFNQPIVLPPGLTHLRMGNDFNQPTELPSGLTYLRMGYDFNQPTVFPSSLVYLDLGYHFNQPIVIPPNVKDIEMGHDFNQPVVLPPGLTHLTIGMMFDQDIDIPPSVICFHGPMRWKPMIQKHIEATYY